MQNNHLRSVYRERHHSTLQAITHHLSIHREPAIFVNARTRTRQSTNKSFIQAYPFFAPQTRLLDITTTHQTTTQPPQMTRDNQRRESRKQVAHRFRRSYCRLVAASAGSGDNAEKGQHACGEQTWPPRANSSRGRSMTSNEKRGPIAAG